MDARVQKMAEVIINYSLSVKPGERVLIRGMSPSAQPLMQAMYAEALKAGGQAFTYLHMSNEDRIVMSNGNTQQIEAGNPMLKMMYETCEAIVRIDASEDTKLDFPIATSQARARAKGEWLSIQMRREGDKSLRRCTTLYPTEAIARDAGMTVDQFMDFLFNACMVHLDDPVAYWQNYAAEQQKLCDYLNGHKKLVVRGKNIDLEMSIDGRIFKNADGKFNMPDGEIFTGPVEDSVSGWVRFNFPAIYEGSTVKGIELKFENGRITQATASENEAYLLAMLDTDMGARTLGEFAIGTNTGIDRFTGQILFDEKIGGTVHMAVGASYVETGGVNKSAIHWDMICDMRDGGEILVDGVRFYENGKFLVSA